MSNEYVTVRNTVTRKVGQVRRRIAEHVIFGKILEIVPDGTKSFVDLKELVNPGSSTVDVLLPNFEDLDTEDPETDEEKEEV